MNDKPSSPHSAADPPSGFWARVFNRLEVLDYHHPFRVLIVSLVVAALCFWATGQFLEFRTSREDLLSPDLEFQKLFKQYREEFQDFDGMIVVVEGGRPESMKRFADALVSRLHERRNVFSEIYYKVDTEYFRSKSLLFLDDQELAELGDKLESHHDFLEGINRSPGLNTLLTRINREISAGMVDTLLTDFLGTGDEAEDDTADLSLLIALLRQMDLQLMGNPQYRSPWSAFLGGEEDSLRSEGYLVSENGRLLFVLLNPAETEGDFTGSKQSVDIIRGMIAEVKQDVPGVQVGLTGSEVIASDEMFTTLSDAQRASQLALVGVAILFVLFYREFTKPLLAVFSLMVGLAWSMGYTTLSIGHLNIMSVIFTTILIGLGIDFGIHILSRYREERQAGIDAFPAMSRTLQQTGRGNLAGAVTTAIAFGAMSFTPFIGIAELGVIAAGGVLLCFLAMVLVLPSLITLEEKWKRPVYTRPRIADLRDTVSEKVYAHYYWIIIISLALLLAAGWRSQNLRFDYNLLNMQAHGLEAVVYEMKVIENAKRASWNAALISNSIEDAREKYNKLKTLPTVGKVESLFEAIPENQEARIKTIQQLAPEIDGYQVAGKDEPFSLEALESTLQNIRFKLRKKEKDGPRDDVFEASKLVKSLQENLKKVEPETAAQRLTSFSKILFVDYRKKMDDLKRSAHPTPVTIEELPDGFKKRFVSKDGRVSILVYPGINIWEREAMKTFLAEMRRIDPKVTGNAVHMFESSRLMIDGYLRGGVYAFIAIFIYLWISLNSVKTAGLVLVPTVAGGVYTLGLMELIGVQFNLANLVILPLIIGIGVVDGVHIVHRYRETPEDGTNVIAKSTGLSVVMTSLTTIVGFGSLMVADHQGVYSLGLLLSLGVGSCLLTSVTLLPALMKWFHARGWRV